MTAERATEILGRINVAILTTAYEIGVDEGAGKRNFDPEREMLLPYRESPVESMAKELIVGETEFAQRCNLVGIVTNDNERRHQETWSKGGPWPQDLRVPIREGNNLIAELSLEEMTRRVPATWALMRQSPGEPDDAYAARFTQAKTAYEYAMADTFDALGADIVVSYSYTKIIENTMLLRFGGRMLNLHPAILSLNDPQRTPGITPTADHWTRYHEGWLATHKKKAVDQPEGEPGTYLVPEGHVAWGSDAGREIPIIHVPRSSRAGVTLHIVEPEVDEGKIVRSESYLLSPEEVTMQGIRERNYAAMREIVTRGILDYIAHPAVRHLMRCERSSRGAESLARVMVR